jgi:two-component system, cell cycle response regulator DivK
MPHALVIDDNAQNLRVLVHLLTKLGVTCTEVLYSNTLPEVLATLESVDVVFLDLEMPYINGYEAKDLLRSHLSGVTIIACTVHISEIHVVLDMGFDGFIGKPLDKDRFPDQLERILSGEPVWERM